MSGDELLQALNDVDLEIVENAENFTVDKRTSKTQLWRRGISVAVLVAALLVIALFAGHRVGLLNTEKEAEPVMVISVPIYKMSGDTYEVYYVTNGEAGKSEVEDYGYPYIDSRGDVFQLNLSAIKGFSDSISGYKKGKVNTPQRLMEAFSVAQKKIAAGEAKEGEIRYLVTIDINEAVMEELEWGRTVENYRSVNDEIMRAEYERLTEEFGYELTWIPKGGYQIAEDYWYYLENGGIYGSLTEEEIKNLPVKEEYAYVFWLTCYESLEFTKCEYKVVCKQAELYRAQQIALEALRQLEVEE